MKIRMRIAVAGSFHGLVNVRSGDVVDVPDSEGARYCKLRYAEPVADSGTETTAVKDDSETRKRRGRPPKPRDGDGNIIRE